LTEVHRFNSSSVEDACEQEIYYYDTNPFDGSYSQYALGRLAAVQYMGGGGGFGTCGTTFTEMYTYNQAGAKVGKRLRVQRQMGRSAPYYDVVTVTQDLNSTTSPGSTTRRPAMSP
jgi:hypothetical protein